MYQEIDLREVAYIATAVAKHKGLIHYVTGLDPKQREVLVEFWEGVLKGKKHFDNEINAKWNDIDFHLVRQLWSSTSCGWGGIGGAAFTTCYTIVIENTHFGFASVYYRGELVYIVKMDEKLEPFKTSGYKNLPGLDEITGRLTIIYQNRNNQKLK